MARKRKKAAPPQQSVDNTTSTKQRSPPLLTVPHLVLPVMPRWERKKKAPPYKGGDWTKCKDQRSSPLFTLPAELRITIYEYAASASELRWRKRLGSGGLDKDPRKVWKDGDMAQPPGMVLACKQLFQEASSIFYSRAKFVFQNTNALSHFLRTISRQNLELVMEMAIDTSKEMNLSRRVSVIRRRESSTGNLRDLYAWESIAPSPEFTESEGLDNQTPSLVALKRLTLVHRRPPGCCCVGTPGDPLLEEGERFSGLCACKKDSWLDQRRFRSLDGMEWFSVET